ncbi:hypothetical protein ES703_45199 [subsurface metagenome]
MGANGGSKRLKHHCAKQGSRDHPGWCGVSKVTRGRMKKVDAFTGKGNVLALFPEFGVIPPGVGRCLRDTISGYTGS